MLPFPFQFPRKKGVKKCAGKYHKAKMSPNNRRGLFHREILFSVFFIGIGTAPASSGCPDPVSALEKLAFEHRWAQQNKVRYRDLKEIDRCLFVDAEDVPTPFPKVKEVLHIPPNTPDGQKLVNFLSREALEKGRKLRYFDVGAGYGVGLRQIKRDHPELSKRLELTAVDVVDWSDDDGLKEEAIKAAGPTITSSDYAPKFIHQDAAKLDLRHERADVITCLESVLYHDDPLETIANLYNQLEDGGVLIVSSSSWATRVKLAGEKQNPVAAFLTELRSANIAVGMSLFGKPLKHENLDDLMENMHTIVLRKKPGTRIQLNLSARVTDIRWGGVRHVEYRRPTGKPALEILPSQIPEPR